MSFDCCRRCGLPADESGQAFSKVCDRDDCPQKKQNEFIKSIFGKKPTGAAPEGMPEEPANWENRLGPWLDIQNWVKSLRRAYIDNCSLLSAEIERRKAVERALTWQIRETTLAAERADSAERRCDELERQLATLRNLVNGSPFDLTDSPKSLASNLKQLLGIDTALQREGEGK